MQRIAQRGKDEFVTKSRFAKLSDTSLNHLLPLSVTPTTPWHTKKSRKRTEARRVHLDGSVAFHSDSVTSNSELILFHSVVLRVCVEQKRKMRRLMCQVFSACDIYNEDHLPTADIEAVQLHEKLSCNRFIPKSCSSRRKPYLRCGKRPIFGIIPPEPFSKPKPTNGRFIPLAIFCDRYSRHRQRDHTSNNPRIINLGSIR